MTQWPGPLTMPSQAPAALVAAYRDLIDRLYRELGSYGVPVPSAVGERVRDSLEDSVEAVLAALPSSQVFYAQDGSEALVITADNTYMVSVDARGRTSSGDIVHWQTGYDA